MVLEPDWPDLALRIILTLIGCGLLGFDRGEHGRPAGVRTVMLVGLSAALAMVAANLLLATSGKTPTSFAAADVMRLPLGILTGIGFIGAGAILKRGNSVEGLTTAGTLWLATVIGILFGGGFLWLGVAGTGCGLIVLTFLGWVEAQLPKHCRGELTVLSTASVFDRTAGQLREHATEIRLEGCSRRRTEAAEEHILRLRVTWRAPTASVGGHPPFIETIYGIPSVREVRWQG